MLVPSSLQRPVAAFLLFATRIVSASCSGRKDSTAVRAGPPASLTIIGGDQQFGVVGQELPQPVVVKVVDANGDPVPGQAA